MKRNSMKMMKGASILGVALSLIGSPASSLNLTINPPQIKQSGIPDIEVVSVSGPNSAAPGERIRVGGRVRNIGFGSAGESMVKYYLSSDRTLSSDDIYLGYDNIQRITPKLTIGPNEEVRIPNSVSLGTKYLLLVADADNQVSESKENNNIGYKAITIGLPDIEVTSVSGPNSAAPGERIRVGGRVRNIGFGSAGESMVKYYLSSDRTLSSNDIYLGYDNITGLSPKNYRDPREDVTIPNSISLGTKYLLLVADAENQVSESKENNNVGYKAITIR
ncbi:MAG: CARDB domain-containing protein [Hormoscilla sp.]